MDYIKVSFIGDIMCERPFLNAANTDRDRYDFDRAFECLAGLFQKSDYVIGNLETVCAGRQKQYTHELYSFNTPDSFVGALKNCGINFVSTANNHCLDRGIAGLARTLDVLDFYGIAHTGTYRIRQEAMEPCVVDIEGLRIGLLSFTYGTNPNMNGVIISDEEAFYVDLLQTQEIQKERSLIDRIKGLLPIESKTKIKKMMGRPYKNITLDYMPVGFDESYLYKLSESIKRTKEVCDYTICLLHCGGQFNREPGEYSEYIMKYLIEQGVDSIIGNHPHIVQKSQVLPNGIAAYCLGNVSISPSSIYVPMDNLPDYSIAVHLYFRRDEKTLEKITVSVLKIQEDESHYLTIHPVSSIYGSLDRNEKEKIVSDTRSVLSRFMCKEKMMFEIQEEWEIIS